MAVIDHPPTLSDPPNLTASEKGFLSFLDMLLDVQPWMEEAACRGMDAIDNKIFFPTRGETQRPAQKICRDCPVTEPCGKYAWDNELLGVWGGMSWRERSRKWGGK